ncbi:MAG: VTT domain-containing protein [Gemmatimonadetes bacterium]|nr:VTT domain-containing protein [Gemmatimonadota bacterium]MDA1102923.1 VTT domain-containing protein [Gemmatimonadota bacterium]
MEEIFVNIETWLGALGAWAYVVAPLVMMVVAILPVPAEAPAMANGILFGPLGGSLVTWTGAMAGAWVSYEVAHRWGRPVARRFASERAVSHIDQAVESAGWWGLIVLRLIPVVAFTALNWGAGLCGVPRRRFLWTTALGIVPGVVLFTWSGVGLSALWRRSPLLTGVVVAFVAVGSIVWAFRRRRSTAS